MRALYALYALYANVTSNVNSESACWLQEDFWPVWKVLYRYRPTLTPSTSVCS